MPGSLIPPHGGRLVNLLVSEQRREELKRQLLHWPSWNLTPRQLCDLELLANGGFSPLVGFLASPDYRSVLRSMRLADGTLWPIPVVLDVPEELAAPLAPGSHLVLRDSEEVPLAVLHVEEIFHPDKEEEALAVYGTTSLEHPGVAALLEKTHPVYLGGPVELLQLPTHYDFAELRQLRLTPSLAPRGRWLRLAVPHLPWTRACIVLRVGQGGREWEAARSPVFLVLPSAQRSLPTWRWAEGEWWLDDRPGFGPPGDASLQAFQQAPPSPLPLPALASRSSQGALEKHNLPSGWRVQAQGQAHPPELSSRKGACVNLPLRE